MERRGYCGTQGALVGLVTRPPRSGVVWEFQRMPWSARHTASTSRRAPSPIRRQERDPNAPPPAPRAVGPTLAPLPSRPGAGADARSSGGHAQHQASAAPAARGCGDGLRSGCRPVAGRSVSPESRASTFVMPSPWQGNTLLFGACGSGLCENQGSPRRRRVT